uniref:Uncharacterized protein n=1 Tax=Octopus bimaculoides TaxID=37653 RepID=A0A0L8GDN8_OCTBM
MFHCVETCTQNSRIFSQNLLITVLAEISVSFILSLSHTHIHIISQIFSPSSKYIVTYILIPLLLSFPLIDVVTIYSHSTCQK